MKVVRNTNFGPRAVTIQKVGMSVVDVDLNHPMAGKDLHFDIEVVDVREASPEEVEHGHVHGDGDGGHEHWSPKPDQQNVLKGNGVSVRVTIGGSPLYNNHNKNT